MATDDIHDLEVLLRSQVPLIAVQTREEQRALEMFRRLIPVLGRPLAHWSVTTGARRIDIQDMDYFDNTTEPADFLRHVLKSSQAMVWFVPDFHPYLKDPVNVRLLKEIALNHTSIPHTVVLVSHQADYPQELRKLIGRFSPALPDSDAIRDIVHEEARQYASDNNGQRVRASREIIERLVNNLSGLTAWDVRRLARQIIHADGAITESDLPAVMQAKYELLDRGGALAFTYDTAQFSEVGGMHNLRRWVHRRRRAFLDPDNTLDTPRGMLLTGVQGGGKSLAAKAVAGLWGLPLLQLDMGTLYNKYHGESERNLREALQTAAAMAPCVLWIDEIEKAVGDSGGDSGVSQRILGHLLTWMAENRAAVFVVATANNIDKLPPELVRKGRLDEIFFVDLPDTEIRAEIFAIHLQKRDFDPANFDLQALAEASEEFSGAEIEQAVVSALYLAHEQDSALETAHILEEISHTRPLAVVMSEPLQRLRDWASERTVKA